MRQSNVEDLVDTFHMLSFQNKRLPREVMDVLINVIVVIVS